MPHRFEVKLSLRYVLPVAALALGAVGAIAIVRTSPEKEGVRPPASAPLVRTTAVKHESLRHRVRTHGTVVPRSSSDLTPEVSGSVIWIASSLVSGGYFEAGEPLFRIDPHDYEVALERARANLTRSQSQVKLTAKELARQENLAGQSVASEANLDAAMNAERAAQASLREARAAIDQAERDLQRTEVHAPYDGRVREESIDVGQWVSRGSPVAKLYAIDYAEVRLPVPDDQLAFLDVLLTGFGQGDPDPESLPLVVLRAEFAGAKRSWTGRIVRTEGEIDAMTRMMHVVARVEDPYRRHAEGPREIGADAAVPLAVGLFVEAEIVGREVVDVMVLPRAALRDGDQVFVVDGDDRLRFREVGVIRRRRDAVVIGSGLMPGERVVTSALPTPVDGMYVRVVPEAEGP